MTEVSGITELQLLEQQITSIQSMIQQVEKSDNTSVTCNALIQNLVQAAEKDSFLQTAAANERLSSSGGGGAGSGAGGGGDGCCVVQ